jgi:Regulator of chromosome condensation (RCC1) repeat
MRRRVDQRYSAPIAAVGVWWSRVGWWAVCSPESRVAGGHRGAGSALAWMLVRALGLGVVVAVVFGLSVSAAGAAAPAGSVLAFGGNEFGQLGSITNTGTNNPNPTPTPVTLPGEIGPVIQVAASGSHSLVVTASGQLYAFGSNFWGQLGSPANNGVNSTPTLVGVPGEVGPVTEVAAGGADSRAVTPAGSCTRSVTTNPARWAARPTTFRIRHRRWSRCRARSAR